MARSARTPVVGLDPHFAHCLTARLLVLGALEQHKASLVTADLGAVYDAFVVALNLQSASIVGNPFRPPSLNSYLQSVASAMASVPATCVRGPQRTRARVVASRLEDVLATAQQTPPDHVAQIFAACVRVAQDAYDAHRGGGRGKPPEIDLKLEADSEKPHKLDCSHLLAAETWFDDAGGPKSNVILTLDARRFDWASLLVLPSVLLHECVAHALQGPWTGRTPSAKPSSFAEGWMDLAALELHNEAIGSVVADTRLLGLPPEATVDDAKREASEYSGARRRVGDDPSDRTYGVRDTGFKAASRVLQVLRYDDPQKAVGRFLKLSVRLNLSSLTTPEMGQRNLLADRINLLFATPTRKVLLALQDVVNTGDVGAFAKAMGAL